MTKILQKDDAKLRTKAKEIPIEKIQSKEILDLISQMEQILMKEDDGVALAAPQIGIALRLFIVSPKAFEAMSRINGEDVKAPIESLVFINPEITKLSKEKKWIEEGCLSVRYLYGKVKRASRATVKAYDKKGNEFTRGASGLLAQIFQHEIDHLDGKLFIDSAKDVEEVEPSKSAS